MDTTVITSITIVASPAQVFAYLVDLKYHYLWNPQIQSIKPMQKLKLGAKYTTQSQVLGTTIKAANTVTSFKPDEEIVLENRLGVVLYKAKFSLAPKDGGTFVKLSVNLSTDKKIYLFTAPVLRQLALRELRTDLQALKIAVENKLQ